MKKLSILKIGGKVIDDPMELKSVLKHFSKIKGPKILVHGGGTKATSLAEKLGIPVQMTEGRRITDKQTLDIVTMVYAGLINKQIISQLQSLSVNSLGLSGADLNVINASKRKTKNQDFGFVGDITSINSKAIKSLLNKKIVPVFCALTHDQKGQLLNTNSDTIASSLAIELNKYFKVKLIFHFDKKGVLENHKDEHSVIKKIRFQDYPKLKNNGVIINGMIPKIENAFHALNNKVSKVIICGTGSKGTEICL